jgi:hypothetical protein
MTVGEAVNDSNDDLVLKATGDAAGCRQFPL